MAFVSALVALAPATEPPALLDPRGERVALARAPEERALVVHFWATWCPSCAEELPVVARAADRCAPQGVRVRIAAAGEDARVVEAYLHERKLAIASLLDPEGRAWRAVGGFGLPSNWIRSADGDRLLTGPQSASQWSSLSASVGCAFDAAEPSAPAPP